MLFAGCRIGKHEYHCRLVGHRSDTAQSSVKESTERDDLLSVCWFNPLMWIAYVLLCRDIEIACDERVIVTVVIACVVVCFLTNPKSGSKTYAAVDGYTDCEGMDIRIDSKEQLERFKQKIDEELDIDKAFLDIVGGAV